MTAILVGTGVAILLGLAVLVLLSWAEGAYENHEARAVLSAHNQALATVLEIERAQHATEVALYEEAWRQRSLQ